MLTRRLLLAAALPLPLLLILTPAVARSEEAPRRFMMENAATGDVVTDDILLSKISLVFFGYTHCPDVCPTSLLQVAAVIRELGPDSARLQPVFVTVDPVRDTADVMREYVKSFGESFVPLRGPAAYTEAMAQAFGAKFEIQKPTGDDPTIYSVDHTAAIIMTGPDGSILKRFTYNTEPATMVRDVREALQSLPPA